VDRVLAHCGGPGVAALEAGAGTGKATRAFAARSLQLTAVEPDPVMAGLLAANCAGFGNVSVVVSSFEEYVPDRPFGLLLSAQAWHWLDPDVRWQHAAEVLAPGGSLALFWNLDRIADQAVQAAVTAAHQDLAPHIEWDTDAVDEDRMAEQWPGPELAGLAAFAGLETALYRWERPLSRSQYLDYLSTHSAYLMLGAPARERLFSRVGAALPNRVPLAEETVLYLARRA
jgi:SAM-dependent methyltransferase